MRHLNRLYNNGQIGWSTWYIDSTTNKQHKYVDLAIFNKNMYVTYNSMGFRSFCKTFILYDNFFYLLESIHLKFCLHSAIEISYVSAADALTILFVLQDGFCWLHPSRVSFTPQRTSGTWWHCTRREETLQGRRSTEETWQSPDLCSFSTWTT